MKFNICTKNNASMKRYQETFDTWNKVAFLYQEKFMDLTLYDETYDFFCNSIVTKKAKLLEIGCGPGNITKYILSKRSDFDILGIDIAPNMIELAKKNNPTAEFAIMDSRHIDTLKEKYDGIVSGFCLPYLSYFEGRKCLENCTKLLNDNGLLYVSFVEGKREDSGYKTSSTGDRTYFYYYNVKEITGLLEKLKFQIIKTFQLDFKRSENEVEVHTIIIAKKQKQDH